MNKQNKNISPEMMIEIENDQSWDNGGLGVDGSHAKKANTKVGSKLGLKLISCRLQENLIDDLKHIASSKGITYQPLLRQILTEYVSMHQAKNHRLA